MGQLTAVLDACVLYPAPLRSFFMYLALSDVFRAKWTEAIHEEWMRNVRAAHPDMTQAQVERIRDLMNSHVRDCVVSGYEWRIPELYLPDRDDRHVLAAALHANAEVIVTFNLADFPDSILNSYEVEAQHPDQFVMRLFESSPELVCQAAKRQRASLKNPPLTVDAYLASLERQGMSNITAKLRQFSDRI